jgi:hypothetical protein
MSRILAGLLLVAAQAAGAPVPTVILPAREGSTAAALRADARVSFVLELGGEVLAGVSDREWFARLAAAAGSRTGPTLAREELMVRERVCPDLDPRPALLRVGGYELLRAPPALRRAAERAGRALPLPSDGVLARPYPAWPEAKQYRAPDPAVTALVARVDPGRWFGTVAELASFPRNSYGSGIHAAHDWILARFAEAGLETSSHTYVLSISGCPGSPLLANPIGLKRGGSRSGEWLVVGAHYDSRNHALCDGALQPRPGANDNASGCAGVIELARVFQGIPTERSIVFACFSGEEQGLRGSAAWVQSLVDAEQLGRVRLMINLDMIGHAIDDRLETRVETAPEHEPWLAVFGAAAATYAPGLTVYLQPSTAAYSDHWPFLQRGIPAVFTWENGASIYPHWHRTTDLPANMLRARELAGGILRMDAAVLAELAGIWGLFADGFEAP